MLPRILLTASILAIVFVNPAFAGQSPAPKSLGTFGDWRTYISVEHGQNVCYMALRTHGAAIKKAKRGSVILMITQRPAENTRDVVSYAAGYNFKATSDVQISVGKANFDLFTQKDTAWSRDAMTDHALAAAIRKSPTLTATGTPATHGAGPIIDTISLKGAAEAYRAIGKACGMVEVESPPKPAPTHKKKPK